MSFCSFAVSVVASVFVILLKPRIAEHADHEPILPLVGLVALERDLGIIRISSGPARPIDVLHVCRLASVYIAAGFSRKAVRRAIGRRIVCHPLVP